MPYEFTYNDNGNPLGIQRIYKFDNGYQASAVINALTRGLWEIAVMDSKGNIVDDTPVSPWGTVGYISDAEMLDTLRHIASLPPRT